MRSPNTRMDTDGVFEGAGVVARSAKSKNTDTHSVIFNTDNVKEYWRI